MVTHVYRSRSRHLVGHIMARSMGHRRVVDRLLRVVDLFAGCGGFSTGFGLVGDFRVIAANDIDADALRAFQLKGLISLSCGCS